MTQYNDTNTIEATANEDLIMYRRVKLIGSSTQKLVGYADAGEVGIGTVRATVASGKDVGVLLLTKEGTIMMVANGAISLNALVYPAADGKVTATVTGEPLGRWVSAAATTDGDWGEVLPNAANIFSDRAGTFEIFDDFTSWDSTFGPFVQTADAGATGTTAVIDAVGGQLDLYCDGDDNDEAYLHTITENFLFAANKPIFFEARLAVTEGSTNAGAFIIGLLSAAGANALQDTEAGPPASYSGVVFYKVAGGLTWSAEVSVGGTQTAITLSGSGVTYTSATFYRFGIEVIPTSATAATVNLYINGTQVGTTSFTYTGATEMDLIVGCKSNGSAEEKVSVDYIHAAQVR